MIKLKKILFIISLFHFVNIQAQENTHTSGGSAIGSGGNINYTIGQLVFNENSDGNFTVYQGVQQAYEIYNVLHLENKQATNIQVSIFPNPIADYLALSLNNSSNGELVYQLFDSNGRLLQTKRKLEMDETINMETLHSAIYYLNILENNLTIKTFKIIKN